MSEISTNPTGPKVWVSVDCVFDHLDEALRYAISQGGNKAKSFAWDVRGQFLQSLGRYRSASADRSPEGQDAKRLDAEHESAVPNEDSGDAQ